MSRPSKTEITAAAMLATLEHYAPNAVTSDMMRNGVEAYGGDVSYIQTSAKWLRDGGVLLVTEKARQNSTWALATDDQEVRRWDVQSRREHLSETISKVRATSLCTLPEVRRTHNQMMATAVQMGADLNIPATEILAMCLPTHVTA